MFWSAGYWLWVLVRLLACSLTIRRLGWLGFCYFIFVFCYWSCFRLVLQWSIECRTRILWMKPTQSLIVAVTILLQRCTYCTWCLWKWFSIIFKVKTSSVWVFFLLWQSFQSANCLRLEIPNKNYFRFFWFSVLVVYIFLF